MKISTGGLKKFIEAYEEEFKEKIDPGEAEYMMICLLHTMLEMAQCPLDEVSPGADDPSHRQ